MKMKAKAGQKFVDCLGRTIINVRAGDIILQDGKGIQRKFSNRTKQKQEIQDNFNSISLGFPVVVKCKDGYEAPDGQIRVAAVKGMDVDMLIPCLLMDKETDLKAQAEIFTQDNSAPKATPNDRFWSNYTAKLPTERAVYNCLKRHGIRTHRDMKTPKDGEIKYVGRMLKFWETYGKCVFDEVFRIIEAAYIDTNTGKIQKVALESTFLHGMFTLISELKTLDIRQIMKLSGKSAYGVKVDAHKLNLMSSDGTLHLAIAKVLKKQIRTRSK